MRTGRLVAVCVGFGLLLGLPTATLAGGTGCPTWGNPGGNPGNRDGQVMGTDDAVARTMAQITDAWFAAVGTTREQVLADRTALVEANDHNGDGLVCVSEAWGTELNPNSKWATFWGDLLDPTESQRFLVYDNHMGTSNNG